MWYPGNEKRELGKDERNLNKVWMSVSGKVPILAYLLLQMFITGN